MRIHSLLSATLFGPGVSPLSFRAHFGDVGFHAGVLVAASLGAASASPEAKDALPLARGATPVDTLSPDRRLAASCTAGVVTCVNGQAGGQSCAAACGGLCCKGTGACDGFSGSVCRDGSCNGNWACNQAGIHGSIGLISGASCVGQEACLSAAFGGTVGDISGGSCSKTSACQYLGHESGNSISSINNCCKTERECIGIKQNGDMPDQCFAPVTTEPTGSPTTSPTTAGPTTGPTTAGPTGSPTTVAPTSTPWTINFVEIISDFSTSSEDEVVMKYEIGKNRTYETFLYGKDCASNIADLTVNTTEVKTNVNGTHDLLTLRHSFDKTAIGNSTIWDSTANKIKFCQIVRLIIPGATGQLKMDIASDIREVVIDFDLSADFAVENELGAGTVEAAAGEANVVDYVVACKCNGPGNFSCEPDPLAPNTQLHVCIKSVSTDVQVKELKSMAVKQGESVLNVILGGTVQISSIADMTYVKAQNGVVVSTFVPTNIFNYTLGASINITGGIDMELVNSGRRLIAGVLDGDALDADGNDQEFELKVDLEEEVIALEGEGGWMDNSGAVLSGAPALLGTALLLAYGV